MGFIDAVKTFFQKYADFKGRASRSEYWWVVLANVLLQITLAIMFSVVLTLVGADLTDPAFEESPLAMLLNSVSILIGLVLIIPSLALTVRRMHDSGKSAWFLLLMLVPFGAIVIFVFMLLDSDPGENKYGMPSGVTV